MSDSDDFYEDELGVTRNRPDPIKPNRTACGYSKVIDRRRWFVLQCLLTGLVCDQGYSGTRVKCELGKTERERWEREDTHA